MSTFRAVILTANEFEDMEVFFPYFRLLEEGVEVDVAAPQAGVIHGEHGYSLKITKTIAEVDPDQYDLLVVPGGFPNGAPATVRKDKKAQEIAKSFFAKKQTGGFDLPWPLAVGISRFGERQAFDFLLA